MPNRKEYIEEPKPDLEDPNPVSDKSRPGRDKIMERYHEKFPRYAFNKHKGYGTRLHRDLIRKYGPCPIHRRTFKGVSEFV